MVNLCEKYNRNILCVGALTHDIHLFVGGFDARPTKHFIDRSTTLVGGMAARAALTASSLGGNVDLWSRVGDDKTGMKLIKSLEVLGVGSSNVRELKESRSLEAYILSNDRGERWALLNYDENLMSDIEASEIPDFNNYDIVLADVRWPAAAQIALRNAKSAGKYAVLDLDVGKKNILMSLCRSATHIISSKDGAESVTGFSDPVEAAHALAEQFSVFVTVTDGSNGCVFIDQSDRIFYAQEALEVDAINTNGAGDVFHGAFVYSISVGHSVQYAIKFATAASALYCSQRDPRAELLNLTIVHKMLEDSHLAIKRIN